jgi:signal transduction histidine kinase
MPEKVLEAGNLQFSVDARILRELGERLVRRPETALIELIKNSYDADSTQCRVEFENGRGVVVEDDGVGMTLAEFNAGWMRIGTASKAFRSTTPVYGRRITGEKGIGRFSVRFLGEHLALTTVADDPDYGTRTRLTATFDWPDYDASEDIGRIEVPYRLTVAPTSTSTGTRLHVTRLRNAARKLDLKQIRTASIGLVSPLQSLIVRARDSGEEHDDPGFRLVLGEADEDFDDIASRVLDAYELRAQLTVRQRKLQLRIYTRDQRKPYLDISDTVEGRCGDLKADVRFFPRRAGAFRDLGIDGRRVYPWIRENAGIAVFDRDFHVSPYGEPGDDWLYLTRDAASNQRHPRSSLAQKHFPMSDAEQTSTSDNWMLRLPESAQVIGVVQVTGARGNQRQPYGKSEGLVAAADREGFIANEAFSELFEIVRGSVEAIAMVDRRRQKEREEAERQRRLRRMQDLAAAAAREIEDNKSLPAADKRRLLTAVSQMVTQAEAHERATRERVRQLEVMSLLGVVAGFMTHEFGVALDALDKAHHILVEASKRTPALKPTVEELETARARLAEFTDYSSAYIRGSHTAPERPYPAAPRLRHVRGAFQQYATERGVTIESSIARDLVAPRVPTSLYDGVLLNLLTNALKATTIVGPDGDRIISFRAWNEKNWHNLEVADTGIPTILRERVFDPLFTTTDSNNDPLGSGMGLGLSLVRASVEAFGGAVRAVDPPPGYSTCIQVRLPLESQEPS